MEEYLQNLKCLRYQMNDIEEEAEKRSVEEQYQRTAIDTMEKDLVLARSETKRLNEEAVEMAKAKDEICCQIVEKQLKTSVMESESVTLSQTLELLQQELVSVSVRLEEKRSYYTKIMGEQAVVLRDQQDWLKSKQKQIANNTSMEEETNGSKSDLVTQLESAKNKLENLQAKKSEIGLESTEAKQRLEQLKQRIDGVPPALKAMDVMVLEEEHKALLTDKAGETEYLQSLHDQIEQLKGISHVVNCQCGEAYEVGLMV